MKLLTLTVHRYSCRHPGKSTRDVTPILSCDLTSRDLHWRHILAECTASETTQPRLPRCSPRLTKSNVVATFCTNKQKGNGYVRYNCQLQLLGFAQHVLTCNLYVYVCMCAMVYLRFGWDLGVLCVIGLLALMNNDVYWIFLKNNKYIHTQKYSFAGLGCPNSKLCPTYDT